MGVWEYGNGFANNWINYYLLNFIPILPYSHTSILVLGLKRKINLKADISSHIINPVIRSRTVGVGFKIF
jgi:hypothetical protein